jgi:superoxide dismutase
MPQLIHGSNYKENGISEFLSPEAFDFAWTQYQSLMLDKLNLLTEGKTVWACSIWAQHKRECSHKC